MQIRRVVPDIEAEHVEETVAFYREIFGFEVGMDMGWIVTLVSPDNPTAQLSVTSPQVGATGGPHITIEVEDVDRAHEAVLRRGGDVIRPLETEAWGVRRFLARDPGGVVVNVMQHVAAEASG